jgi:hypothetical protein
MRKVMLKDKCLAMKEKGFAKTKMLSHEGDQKFCQEEEV